MFKSYCKRHCIYNIHMEKVKKKPIWFINNGKTFLSVTLENITPMDKIFIVKDIHNRSELYISTHVELLKYLLEILG